MNQQMTIDPVKVAAQSAVAQQRRFFASGVTRDVGFRLNQLKTLRRLLRRHHHL